MRLTVLLAAFSSLALAGCASQAPDGPARAPGEAAAPGAPPPTPRPTGDQCGAGAAQKLVGRPRTEIPVPVLPALQRVACTTCPVTLDFNPRRLNFLFDAETGVVREVKCG